MRPRGSPSRNHWREDNVFTGEIENASEETRAARRTENEPPPNAVLLSSDTAFSALFDPPLLLFQIFNSIDKSIGKVSRNGRTFLFRMLFVDGLDTARRIKN